MEELLRVCLGRRTKYTRAKLDPTTASPAQTAWNQEFILSKLRMPDDDMIFIFNEWREDVGSWMRPSTLTRYNKHLENGKKNKAQQLGKSGFNSYLFQLSGCRFLVHVLIQLPLVSSVSSRHLPIGRLLTELMTAYQEHKKTTQYSDVVQRSSDHQQRQRRLRNQIWWAEYDHAQGQELASQVADGTVSFWDLNGKQQKLVEDFDCRRSGNTLHNLHQERSYRGAGHEVTTGIRGW